MGSTNHETSGVRPVKSAVHAIEVLEFLAKRPHRPAKMKEISDATGIPKSSLYALLKTLTDRNWVRRDATGTLYSVGLRSLMTGVSYLDSDPVLRTVKPWLQKLNEELDETLHLGRLDESDIVYLATKESSQYLRAINRVGRRLPASATSLGKALLALQPNDQLHLHLEDPLARLTENTITDPQVLAEQLEVIRERGYATDLEESTAGLKCFGFALRLQSPPVDALSCSVPLARLNPKREKVIIETMQAAVRQIEDDARHSMASGF
jgi:DNA-binding IclR family transcriptional regulator